MQGDEESAETWATRQWQKYVEYGQLIDEAASPDVKVLVAVTNAGQFGSVFGRAQGGGIHLHKM